MVDGNGFGKVPKKSNWNSGDTMRNEEEGYIECCDCGLTNYFKNCVTEKWLKNQDCYTAIAGF